MSTYEELLEYRNSHNKFASFLGIRTTKMEEGYAQAELIVQDEYENAIGSVHGGCLFALADTTGGSAAASYGMKMTTIDSNIHYLAAGIGTRKLIATAKKIKSGKRIFVCDVEVKNEMDQLLVKGTFSFFNLGIPLIDTKENR